MQEIWKDIAGYEGLYMVSSIGRVKSLERWYVEKSGRPNRIPETIFKPTINNAGYYSVTLSKLKVGKKGYLVHRLVAEAFIEKQDDRKVVNHKNCERLDNRFDNLEWCTQKENIHHAVSMDLFQRKGLHYKAKPIINLETGIFYDCIEEAAFTQHYSRGKLKDRLNGKTFNNTSFIYA